MIDLRSRSAVLRVERAHDEQAGELPAGAGGRLERRPGHPRDLAERALQAPEQLERALDRVVGLVRVQPLEPRERRDGLRDLRVVLHRARPERVEAGVHPVVDLRQPREVPDEVAAPPPRGARRALGAVCLAGSSTAGRRAREALRAPARAASARAACPARLVPDAGRARPHHAGSARNSFSRARSISSRVRRSVTATSSARPSASGSATPARNPASIEPRAGPPPPGAAGRARTP